MALRFAPRSRRDRHRRPSCSSPRALAWFWPFAREEPHGHPPFYAIVGLLGDVFVPSWDLLPASPVRTDPGVQPGRAEPCSASLARRWGVAGRHASRPGPRGSCNRTCLAMATTRRWMACWRRSGLAAVLVFARAVEAPGRWVRWLVGRSRFGSSVWLGRRHEVDRLVLADPVRGLGDLGPKPPGGPESWRFRGWWGLWCFSHSTLAGGTTRFRASSGSSGRT